MPPDNWLDTAEKLSRILSIAAIPIVLAIGGWLIQRQLQDQTIRRDYVQLSLSILQNPDSSKVPAEIRDWAVDLLNENSPTKLSPEAIQKLKSGVITLSGFNFVPSNALTPDLQQRLEASLKSFKSYLVNFGFSVPPETISVDIRPGTLIDDQGVALWDRDTHSIKVAEAFANDEPSVLRQLAHDILMPPGQRSTSFGAIESGLATYFPCSFANNAVLAAKASPAGKVLFHPQDLQNHRKFAEIKLSDPVSVQNDGSAVWGGTFWDIRQLLGAQLADPLIAKTWQVFSQTPERDAYTSFANNLIANSRSVEGGRYADQIRDIFRARGLNL